MLLSWEETAVLDQDAREEKTERSRWIQFNRLKFPRSEDTVDCNVGTETARFLP